MPTVPSRQRVSNAQIAEAGATMGLSALTMHGVAERVGLSEMTLYRRTGGIAGLRSMVANEVLRRAPLPRLRGKTATDALLDYAARLHAFVREHSGIGEHLLSLTPTDAATLAQVDQVQQEFAATFGWSLARASIVMSIVAEHAVALAVVPPAGHEAPRRASELPPELSAIRAGAEATERLVPAERFELSMRAAILGAIEVSRAFDDADQRAAGPS